ncbi:MAG: bifunctional (p)ppGpp synthetase/guanosine-3',5'-bis(diphosphate) 3'-pyrophosphohydrolase, partial [Candidatus Gracilibacteria bacterium]|nr:bifunctional (p)ppGpp synthetase/guanosine-3',5'-bis(diphosphate) 3'-pyrophosphohydrolase [Candidatus Gracilibacteria bacterium]
YEDLVKACSYIRGFDKESLHEVYQFAEQAHQGQKRASGEDFTIHPLQAALTLTSLKVDQETLLAALLHDVVEDTEVTLAEIEKRFGKAVARLVDGVTKLTRVKYRINFPDNRNENQIESLRKLLLVMAQDLRVVLIKLADRLHNMNSLSYFRPEKRVRIAKETLEIYAPLADRLGIWEIKWKLEDEAFRYLYPLEYKKLEKSIKTSMRERKVYIAKLTKILEAEARKAHLEVKVSGRTKHVYSIFRKMQTKHKELDEIYDIFALRVVVKSIADCYSMLGVIHDLWRPKPGRFKDYIAVPKANGYQSLHTTVFGVNGILTEFQIRTRQMHEEAEYGVSSHWYYKEKGRKNLGRAPTDQLGWVNSIVELQNNLQGNSEFLEGLKIDVFKDRIFVFTPQGDVKDLPVGATCIDFAYTIHTNLGHRTKGCKVNGLMVPIDTVLKTGDLVDIISSKNIEGPKRDWLNFVATSQAKSKIRAWFKDHAKEQNIKEGRQILNKKLSQVKDDLTLEKVPKAKIAKAISAMSYDNFDAILAALGEGAINATQVLKKMYSKTELLDLDGDSPSVDKLPQVLSREVVIEGESNFAFKFANCCNPQPGEGIVGYVTRGKGVSIHTDNCSSLRRLDPDRILDAQWKGQKLEPKRIRIRIEGKDRLGLMADIGGITAQTGINILASNGHIDEQDRTRFINEITIEVREFEDFEKMIYLLEKLPGIEKVRKL